MKVTYTTTVLGFGNHAAIKIPDSQLAKLGANKRAPLRITINGYSYHSTATGVDGKCMVVFPTRDRLASGVAAGDTIRVTMELESGYRHVDIPQLLLNSLHQQGLLDVFMAMNYTNRKAYCRLVADAKTEATQQRRVQKIIAALTTTKE